MNTITQDETGGKECVQRFKVDLLSFLYQLVLAYCPDMEVGTQTLM